MKPFGVSRWVLVALLIVFLFSIVSARESGDSSPSTGRVTSTVTAPPRTEALSQPAILPLSVRPTNAQTLSSISASEKTAQTALVRERTAYQTIQQRLQNAAAAEQVTLHTQLSVQRQRLLISILNRLTVVYQRVSLIIDKLDPSLVRLRAAHSSNPRIANFDARVESLEKQVASMHRASEQTAARIESCQTAVNLGDCVRGAQKSTADLLASLRTYFASYRELVQSVLSK